MLWIAIMADCLFCKIVAKDIPAKLVFEDDRCVAFRDVNPQAPTHVLIVPRKHIATLNDVAADDEALVGHLVAVARDLARTEGLDARGFRTLFNTGAESGQTVFHIHLHLLGGRAMGWPPG
jgi:histidine triad (HIT) family protein